MHYEECKKEVGPLLKYLPSTPQELESLENFMRMKNYPEKEIKQWKEFSEKKLLAVNNVK